VNRRDAVTGLATESEKGKIVKNPVVAKAL
jgi:hypothetical protein